jgi:hypothetical protein
MAKDSVVTRLRRSLAEFLNPDDEVPLPRRTTARQRMRPAALTNDFEQRLKSLLERPGQGALLAGRVNVIGLQKAKERLGSAWERVAERADRIARNTIERHLGEDDIYTSANNITYVMVFARLSPEQAKAKCLMIGEEIAKALFGESGGDLLEVKTAVMRVDGKLDLENVSLTDQLFSSISSADDLDFAEGESVPAVKPKAQPSSSADLLAGLRFSYRPIWDQARNVISTYLCVAQVPTSDVGSAVSEAELALAGDGEAVTRLDAAVRQRVLEDLDQLVRENRRLLLTLPIHFETMGSVVRRREYLADIGRRAAGEAGKLLVIEITGVPEGVPQSRLVDLIAPLRPLCRGVMLRVRLGTAEFAQFKGCGAVALGCDIGAHPGPEFALMQQMNRFNRSAAAAAMATYLHGAHSLSQVAASIGAGFNYVDGDAVAKLVDHPRHVANFQLTDLYRPLIKA